jgi:hypothetical protein
MNLRAIGAGCYWAPLQWRRRGVSVACGVVSPGRTIGFLSALAAVIAAVGTAIGWLNANVSGETVYFTGLALTAGSVGLMAPLMSSRGLGGWPYAVRCAAICAAMAATAVVAGLVAFDSWEHVTAYVYVAIAAVPLFWDAYQLDKANHKPCPDCCESVKRKARVCRFCRYEFAPRRGAPSRVDAEATAPSAAPLA